MARTKKTVEEVETPKVETKLNEKQKEYLNTLEIYKVKNPAKWEVKKDILLAKLNEIK